MRAVSTHLDLISLSSIALRYGLFEHSHSEMSSDPKTPEPNGKPGDSAADLIHDLASKAPAKGLETVKAASDAVQSQTGDDRKSRIERRAYELWEASGGHQGSQEDFWYKAEAEIAAEDG